MTLRSVIRPAIVLLAAAGLTACGAAESDPHRFESMARSVAEIPLDGQAGRETPPASAGSRGLRPALRVEVLDPHALWDARDAELGGAVRAAAPRLVAAAAPAMAEEVGRQVSARVDQAADRLRPAVPASDARTSTALVQLGAYSSRAAAGAAWARLKAGPAASTLDGATPLYETVEVGDRTLVRLKVRAPASGAGALCAAAGIDDPWCRRTA